MEERPFLEKSIKPTGQAIQAALGGTFVYYKNLLDLAGSFLQEWAFTKSGGWTLKVHDRKKALFYLIPLNDRFRISLAIRENERDIFLHDDELESLHEKIMSAKRYTEGFALQFDIVNKNGFQSVELFISKLIKMRTQRK